MSENRNDYLIDIDKVIGPKLKKKLPRFAVKFLKRRIHQDQMNECILTSEHFKGAEFFDDALKYVGITYKLRGAEKLGKDKKYIFACNHPLGGPEALIIGSAFYKIYGGGFKVPSNQLLMHMKPLAEFFTPVKVQSGSQSREISARIAAMFESGEPVLVFYAFQHDRDRIKARIDCRELKTSADIDDWNAKQIPVAIAHPASVGHGLNLQEGGHIIIWYGLTWSLELYQQANERLNRPGQTNICRIYHLILQGTADELVLAALKSKDTSQSALIEALKKRVEVDE